MPKTSKRKLSEIEIMFVQSNSGLNLAELIKKLPDVDHKELEALYNHHKDKGRQTEATAQTGDVNSEEAFIAGNLMGKREGITVMTQSASELADARQTLRVRSNPNFTNQNKDKIHTIKKK